MISLTGKGLGIIVDCEPFYGHIWMSFALWYSIRKRLPDAKVVVTLPRSDANIAWRWPFRARIPLVQYSGKMISPKWDMEEVIRIPPHVMAFNSNIDAWGPETAKSEKISTFVDYQEGVGKFVLSSWIHKLESPFNDAYRRFATPEMTMNERNVLAFWQGCVGPYALFA